MFPSCVSFSANGKTIPFRCSRHKANCSVVKVLTDLTTTARTKDTVYRDELPETKEIVVRTIKERLTLLSVLAMLATSAIATATASALPTAGPFWQVGGAQLPVGTKKAITGEFFTASIANFYQHIGTIWLKSTCQNAATAGSIFNGTQHGEGEGTSRASSCTQSESTSGKGGPYTLLSECKPKEPIEVKSRSSLWYRTTNVGKTRTGTEQALFVPAAGNVFVTATLLGSGCGVLSEAKISIDGSEAAEPRPQNTEVSVGRLIFPTEQQRHLWQPKNSPEETQVALTVEKTEADITAEGEGELKNGEVAGIIE